MCSRVRNFLNNNAMAAYCTQYAAITIDRAPTAMDGATHTCTITHNIQITILTHIFLRYSYCTFTISFMQGVFFMYPHIRTASCIGCIITAGNRKCSCVYITRGSSSRHILSIDRKKPSPLSLSSYKQYK